MERGWHGLQRAEKGQEENMKPEQKLVLMLVGQCQPLVLDKLCTIVMLDTTVSTNWVVRALRELLSL